MTRARLIVRPSCTRHARASDAVCPCSRAPADATALRLSRAALAAFGACTMALATACGTGPDTSPASASESSFDGVTTSTSFTTSTEASAVTLPGGSTLASSTETTATSTDTGTTLPESSTTPESATETTTDTASSEDSGETSHTS